jgi:hypothetical protein
MLKVEHHVGRLIEVRADPITTSADQNAVVRALTILGAQLGGRLVIAADYRRATTMPSSVSINLKQSMRSVNTIIERSAILLPPASLLGSQLNWIVQEAGSSSRRTFETAVDLKAWLGEVLVTPERARLDLFLPTS